MTHELEKLQRKGTKPTCPICHATVLSTSRPNLMGTTTDIAQELAQQIPDNNDMITMQMHVSKRAAVLAALAATPAVGGEPLNFPYQRTFDAICAAVNADKTAPFAIHVSVKTFQEAFNNHRDAAAQSASPLHTETAFQNLCEVLGLQATPLAYLDAVAARAAILAASPLRGRDETIEQCALIAEGFDAACNSPRMKLFVDAGLVMAIYKRDGEIGAAIRALASASPPEQPAAAPLPWIDAEEGDMS